MHGVDVSANRITAIRAGRVDLSEADRRVLAADLGSERFVLTSDPTHLAEADAVLICVPTPIDPPLVPDLSAVEAACAAVVGAARPGQTLVGSSRSRPPRHHGGCARA
ncbi:hypothetical protein [Pseudonocardia pini]|uniref:hypothetical protein n=1 Tax=Pseudonocardia pini TaxID=2758030 RepID=UPI0015F0E761|nr:hypothetical protein [Pseudonocardia pini]